MTRDSSVRDLLKRRPGALQNSTVGTGPVSSRQHTDRDVLLRFHPSHMPQRLRISPAYRIPMRSITARERHGVTHCARHRGSHPEDVEREQPATRGRPQTRSRAPTTRAVASIRSRASSRALRLPVHHTMPSEQELKVGRRGLEPRTYGLKGPTIASHLAATSTFTNTASPTRHATHHGSIPFHATNPATLAAL